MESNEVILNVPRETRVAIDLQRYKSFHKSTNLV
jgi:hypothetical protein